MKQELKRNDPIRSMKLRLRDHLKLYFSNIEMDYLISQFGTDKNLKFEFITDYCDPILRVVVQFPDTFWHNEDIYVDLNKNYKLEQYGWKVYTIPSNNPSFAQIDNILEDI
jgi:very-short-patch-repair endonuclease